MSLEEILSCYSENIKRWDMIKILHSNRRIIPFIGAGMSVPVYPQWKEAIIDILNGDKEEVEKLNRLFASNKNEDACEYVKSVIGENGFINKVNDKFSIDRFIKSGEDVRRRVNTTILPDVFKGPIFTTNFERLIEYCYCLKNLEFDSMYSLSNMVLPWATLYDAIRGYKHNIYKIHGDIEDTNSLVFSKQQYDAIYNRKEFVEVLKTVCQNMNFLFMGCSLNGNDRYVNILSGITKEFNSKGVRIQNFAFISLPNKNDEDEECFKRRIEEKERFFESIGIFPIWYPHNKHESIQILLAELSRFEIENNNMFKEKYKELYVILVSLREKINNGDVLGINENIIELQLKIQEVYLLSERFKYAQNGDAEKALSVIKQYNKFVEPYRDFIKEPDRTIPEAQKKAKKATREYGVLVDMVVKMGWGDT